MKKEDIHEAISDISDDLIMEAQDYNPQNCDASVEYSSVDKRQDEAPRQSRNTAPKRSRVWRPVAIAAATLFAFSLSLLYWAPRTPDDNLSDKRLSWADFFDKETPRETDPPTDSVTPTLNPERQADDYTELLSILGTFTPFNYLYGSITDEADGTDFDVQSPTSSNTPKDIGNPNPNAMDSPDTPDYSETNTQVTGIDEADIIKTDGEFIYRLTTGGEIVIIRANGANSFAVARFSVIVDPADSDDPNDPYYNISQIASDFYILGDKLIVILNNHRFTDRIWGCGDLGPPMDIDKTSTNTDTTIPDVSATNQPDEPNTLSTTYKNTSDVILAIYDIQHRNAPKLLHEVGQDGYYHSSRMMDGVIYLISSHQVYDTTDIDKPELFVPCLIEDGQARVMPLDDIYIAPLTASRQYTVLSAISVDDGTILSSASVLGYASTIYMSHDNIYITNHEYEETSGEPRQEDPYTVVDYTSSTSTRILRYAIHNGTISYAAEGTIDGSLLNQFSMDEKDGYLRLVTTINQYSYSIYEDEHNQWQNYKALEDINHNALYVLSSDLNIVGAIRDIAPDERVYSVRFDGNIGYFVTFRQVDPLFTVDLSDPTNPVILNSLKIPGFSEYLHPYLPGHLFGLGMNADETTGRTDSMKMSMFDTTDPHAVTEKHTLSLPYSYSEALYNHKAIVISAARDIIAFPSEYGYSVYGYSDEKGFYPRADLRIDRDDWSWSTVRGLYIGDYFYAVSDDALWVYRMDDFSSVCDTINLL